MASLDSQRGRQINTLIEPGEEVNPLFLEADCPSEGSLPAPVTAWPSAAGRGLFQQRLDQLDDIADGIDPSQPHPGR